MYLTKYSLTTGNLPIEFDDILIVKNAQYSTFITLNQTIFHYRSDRLILIRQKIAIATMTITVMEEAVAPT